MRKLFEKFENNFLKYSVAALLMVIPLYPKFPLFNIPGSWVSVRLEDFLIAFIILGWFLIQLKSKFPIIKESLPKIIIGYLLIGFLSLLSALTITNSVVPHLGLLHTLRRVEYLAGFFIALSSIKSFKDVIFYLQVILLTMFVVFLYGIGQKFFLLPVISTMNVEFAKGFSLRLTSGARVSSTFAGHYDLGAYLVLLMPLVTALIIGVKSKIGKIFSTFVFLCSFWLLMVSASRISFIAYLLGIFFTLWFLRRKLFIIPVIGLSVLLSFSAPQLTSRYEEGFQAALKKINHIQFTLPGDSKSTIISFMPEPTSTPGVETGKTIRFIPTPTPTPIPEDSGPKREYYYGSGDEVAQVEDRSASIRFRVEWPRAIRAFLKNPLLGTGYSSISLATDNDYLRALGEIGILGFLALMIILLTILFKTRHFLFSKENSLEKAVIVGITGGFLGFLANALFIDVFEASKVAITFWLLMGILIGVIKISSKKE
jgi:hypothetical protein